ncbi:uncharacterized protein LOC106063948 [Biomphalaria glabrata]|uniref:Uncharacterized protein LOC106063948 n=1 Tax=Biomphalaria glabrata TaxID=6526 RepID=A0A9U8E939_BIOGL|nr:uncharacterized protein LOC106063948 [Biomphalaria glabrata]
MALVHLVALLSVLVIVGADSFYDIPVSQDPKPREAISDLRYACTMDNKGYYNHGDIFSLYHEARCVTFRCEAGVIHEFHQGCLNRELQKCVYLNHSWNIDCHTFTCIRRLKDGYYSYEGLRSQINCKDPLTQTCKGEGELFRSLDKSGHVKNRCTCRILPNRSSEILCTD